MLRQPDSLLKTQVATVALAIKVSDNSKQKHVAFLYQEKNNWHLLHLGWHQLLIHENWDNTYHWIPFEHLEPELIETLVDNAVIIGSRKANNQIPYSVVFSDGQYFDEENNYIRHEIGEGLTCATFILAMFRRWSLPLVDETTWPIGRKEDSRWALRIVRTLFAWSKKYGVSIKLTHFFKQLRHRWSLRRFRPEEVCACAGLFHGESLNFQTIEPISCQITNTLSS
jgi:hypothetical protein